MLPGFYFVPLYPPAPPYKRGVATNKNPNAFTHTIYSRAILFREINERVAVGQERGIRNFPRPAIRVRGVLKEGLGWVPDYKCRERPREKK